MPPKRPPQRPRRADLLQAEREALAAHAMYVGSPEHKDEKWWSGLPMARQLPKGKNWQTGKANNHAVSVDDRRGPTPRN